MGQPEHSNHPNISAAITKAAQENQVVFIGDTDHGNSNVASYLRSPELLDAAQKAGVKHVFIEMDARLQDLPDKLASGELSRDQFLAEMGFSSKKSYVSDAEAQKQNEELADFILGAKNRGMKVHFGDQNIDDFLRTNNRNLGDYFDSKVRAELEKNYADENFDSFNERYVSVVSEVKKTNISIGENDDISEVIKATPSAMALLDDLSPEESEVFFNMANIDQNTRNKVFADLRLNETDSVQYALDVADGQKFMMIWGSAHDAPRDYLNERGIKNYMIDIHQSPLKDYKGNINPLGHSGAREPDANAYLSSDKVENVASNAKDERGFKPAPSTHAAPHMQPVM